MAKVYSLNTHLGNSTQNDMETVQDNITDLKLLIMLKVQRQH